MTRHKKPVPFFFRRTPGLDKVTHLVAASLDRQYRVKVKKIPPSLSGRGEKITVTNFRLPPRGGRGTVEVVARDGQLTSFFGVLESESAITSGSTGNTAIGLKQLGIEHVGVIGAVGDDLEGGQLLADLNARRIEYGVVKSDTTSLTLRLQDEAGQIVLLCKKGKFNLGTTEAGYAASVRPQVLAITSLRPAHLSWALDVFQRLADFRGRDKTFRAFIPHPDLLESEHVYEQISTLAALTDIAVMNEYEFHLISDGDFDSGEKPRLEFDPRTWVVTRDARGAEYRERGSVRREVAPFKTKVVEPAGAGDVFLATILSKVEPGKPLTKARLEEVVREAGIVAAHKVGSHGPWTLPTPERLKKYKKNGR